VGAVTASALGNDAFAPHPLNTTALVNRRQAARPLEKCCKRMSISFAPDAYRRIVSLKIVGNTATEGDEACQKLFPVSDFALPALSRGPPPLASDGAGGRVDFLVSLLHQVPRHSGWACREGDLLQDTSGFDLQIPVSV
jgi:hypothetical protein